jgi:hypothetical protein
MNVVNGFPSLEKIPYPKLPKIPKTKESYQLIRKTFMIGILLWTILVFSLDLYPTNMVEFLILCIPYILFLINFTFTEDLVDESENDVIASNYISLGILLVIPLLSWIKQDDTITNLSKFIKIALVSIVLSLLSLIDFWIPKKSVVFMKSLRSIFSTISIVLIVYAITLYMTETIRKK